MMDFILGIVGFAGFESLRIYKRIWARLSIPPGNNKIAYALILPILGIFSGVVAYTFANESKVAALYLGFSVPSGLKAILDSPQDSQGIAVEDYELANQSSFWNRLLFYLKNYFIMK